VIYYLIALFFLLLARYLWAKKDSMLWYKYNFHFPKKDDILYHRLQFGQFMCGIFCGSFMMLGIIYNTWAITIIPLFWLLQWFYFEYKMKQYRDKYLKK